MLHHGDAGFGAGLDHGARDVGVVEAGEIERREAWTFAIVGAAHVFEG